MSLAKRIGLSALCLWSLSGAISAQPAYDPGASDTEIRIGNINPYSGPVAAYGEIGKALTAYFTMVNDRGGINGRKIAFISYDDAYSPPKTFEHARRLIEQDEVLFVFQSLGTPQNLAIRQYLNDAGVPQLFVASPATTFGDPENYPWTMGWNPNLQSEGRIYAKYILENLPDARIGLLYQNDEFGKDMLRGLTDGLEGRLDIEALPYEVADASVDGQIAAMAAAGVTVFINGGTPKFAAQAIRKMAEIGWKPQHILVSVSASVGAVLVPAGVENAVGTVSASYIKDPTDGRWANDPDFLEWLAFMQKYMPGADLNNTFYGYAYGVATVMEEVLRRCGDDLTRANIMRQAADLHDLTVPMLQPGLTVNTSPTDFFPIEAMQMVRFDGKSFVPFGPVLEAEVK